MNLRGLWFLWFLGTGVAFPALAVQRPVGKTVTVDGVAAITEGHVAAAKELAVKDALRAAVEQVVGLYLVAETRVQNYQLLEDNIYTRAEGFVNWYEVLKTTREGEVLRVRVRAQVGLIPLTERLKALGLLREWRIMVVIPERHVRRPIPDPAAETEIIRQLKEAGFLLVDQKQVAAVRAADELRLAQAGDVKAARAVAQRFGADILITGEALSQWGATAGGQQYGGLTVQLVSCSARVEVRAIRVDTGEIIAAGAKHANGAAGTEELAAKTALTRAGAQVAEMLIPKLAALPAAPAQQVQLLVHGFASLTAASQFEEALRNLPGVQKVFRQEFSEGAATYDVEVLMSAQRLAEFLERHETLRPFRLAVTAATVNRIVARTRRPQN